MKTKKTFIGIIALTLTLSSVSTTVASASQINTPETSVSSEKNARLGVGVFVKALKQIYKTLPSSVKKKFGTQAKFVAALAVYEHFTGDIEAQMIKDLKKKGLSTKQATAIAKTLTFLAF